MSPRVHQDLGALISGAARGSPGSSFTCLYHKVNGTKMPVLQTILAKPLQVNTHRPSPERPDLLH